MVANSRATIVFPGLPKPFNEFSCIIDVPKNTKAGTTLRVYVSKADPFANLLSFSLH